MAVRVSVLARMQYSRGASHTLVVPSGRPSTIPKGVTLLDVMQLLRFAAIAKSPARHMCQALVCEATVVPLWQPLLALPEKAPPASTIPGRRQSRCIKNVPARAIVSGTTMATLPLCSLCITVEWFNLALKNTSSPCGPL